MINLFQYLHAFFYGHNHQFDYKNTNKLKWFASNVLARLFEKLVFVSIYLRGCIGLRPKPLNNNNPLVVSFTSFPARINYVWMVVDTLMRQEFLPRCIYLFCSREQFPNEREEMPKRLLDYEKLGLKIVFVDKDLKPHKKYYYICQLLTDECFVTVDDDLLYRKDVLKRLWRTHQEHPNSVCANIGRRINIKNGVIGDYSQWECLLENKMYSGPDIIATGCGGILYPPFFYLRNRNLICNEDVIYETSLRADDLWLKVMEILTETEVVVNSYYAAAASIPCAAKSALSITNRNNGKSGNDEQWKALDSRFQVNKRIISILNA